MPNATFVVRLGQRSLFVVALLGGALASGCSDPETLAPVMRSGANADWPMYGRDPEHTFSTTDAAVSASNVAALKPAWSFPTGDAVSAVPTVVGGVVYVGAWDGFFYALDAATGALKWRFAIDCQNSVRPVPAQCVPAGQTAPDRSDTEGGLIVSTAAVADGKVYFAGGKTLYCLDATKGDLVWKHVQCGNPDAMACAGDEADPTIIFSSPIVVGTAIIFGHTADGADGYRGGIVAVSAADGAQLWRFEVDPVVDASGEPVLGANGLPKGGLNRGCGSVWSSAAVDAQNGLVVFGTGDCQGEAPPPYHEAVLALEAATGRLAWAYRPRAKDTCDLDFGSSANVITRDGERFFGIGGKDGTYYLLRSNTTNPSGELLWKRRVVFGGAAGGFIGTAAFDGKRIYGGTALGEFGEDMPCDPSDKTDTPLQDPSFHALDPATGAVAWQANKNYTFASSTVVNDVVFSGVGNVLLPSLRAYDTGTGKLLASFTTKGAVNSGVAAVGKRVYFGSGNSFDGSGSGVQAYALP